MGSFLFLGEPKAQINIDKDLLPHVTRLFPKKMAEVVKFDANFEISKSNEEAFTQALSSIVNEYGGQISIIKDPKFEDLGLVEIEKKKFQCLICSKIQNSKFNAVRHLKTVHLKENQLERKIQCPRCSEEVPKSGMNPHMDLKHGVKNFNQLLKRSFQPEAEPDSSENSSNKKPKKTKAGPKKSKKQGIKDEGEINMPKMILDNDGVDPLNSDLNNNETKPTKATLKVKGGPKKPDSSENSSNKAKTGPKKPK